MTLIKPNTTMEFLKQESKIPMSERKKQVTETIEIEHKLKNSEGETEIDFLDSDQLNDFVDDKSKVATEQKEKAGSFKTIDEIKGAIATEESAASNFTADEMRDIAEVIMGVIDMGISTGLRFWSGDSSDFAYSLPIGKKNMLVKQMTMILVKYQVKFKIEFLFFLSLLVVYSVPFMKAKEVRGLVKSAKKQQETKQRLKQEQQAANKLKQPENAEVIEDEEVEIIIDAAEPLNRTQSGIKRKGRGPRK